MFGLFKVSMAATELEVALEEVIGKSSESSELATNITNSGIESLKSIVGKEYKSLDPLVVAAYSIALDAYMCDQHNGGDDYIHVCREVHKNLLLKIKSKFFVKEASVANKVVIKASMETFPNV